ncbi:hypothetical protein ACFPIJ_57250 [Dactylosporangium cerinum]|uniref:Glycoside hydrolase family 65 central catalytic domain-containing protein n=1 Tax=Dactylosporangium cerinum TaxID=1434730 RepID=A0ABV9WF36_9ACTN
MTIVDCAGALFPWRTINGEEASAYYAAGTAQYHIDADIAYALDQYVKVTGDSDLLFRHGAELLVETARMWAGLGFFSQRHGGRFVIHKVTGPDEYTTVVDNKPVHEPDGGREPDPGRRRRGSRSSAVPTRLPAAGRAHRPAQG